MPIPSESYRERRYAEAGWSRSKRGNLWQRWAHNDTTYTVFQDVHGAFKICIVDPDSHGPWYVPRRFLSEWAAYKVAEEIKAEIVSDDERTAVVIARMVASREEAPCG